jgi:hypothetical protein
VSDPAPAGPVGADPATTNEAATPTDGPD